MNRRNFIRTVGISSAGVAIGTALPFQAFSAQNTTRLTILHTNDTHSRIEPFPNDGRKFGGLGGAARRAELINKIRAEGNEVLLLDAGDIFQGTPYFNHFGGELEFKLMSKMGYDATTIGNHDFDNGIDGLQEQLPHANFEILSANYDFSATSLKNSVKTHKVFNKGGIRVGVFGLGIELEGLVLKELYGNTRWTDPIPVAEEMVRKLKHEKCDLIICLSHLGLKYESGKVSDETIAQNVSGIDLIIGGHTHTFLEEPVAVAQSDGSITLINQVGWAGINLGRIDYTFSGKLKKQSIKTASIEISEKSRGI